MMRSIIVSIALAVGLLLFSGPANAKKKPRSYTLKCAGEDNQARPAGLSGIMQLTDPTDAVGTVFLNIADGGVTEQLPFTATIVNGTAAADGTGGNGIPAGCFSASIDISGDTFGLFSSLFGCYNKGNDGFYAVQTSSAQVTCEASSM